VYIEALGLKGLIIFKVATQTSMFSDFSYAKTNRSEDFMCAIVQWYRECVSSCVVNQLRLMQI
jgi:hypothetical protein